MTENNLKTLKEITNRNDVDDYWNYVHIEELRTEAVNIRNADKSDLERYFKLKLTDRDCQIISMVIKTFFNIEDTK